MKVLAATRSLGWVVALALLAHAQAARAQYNVPAQVTGTQQEVIIARGDEPVAPVPIGWELGASLDFLTRDGDGEAPALKFTDVALFRVHGLLALRKRVELFGGLDLLAKQPSTTDDQLWQSALLGARLQGKGALSGYLRAQLGPGLSRDGAWLTAEAAAQARISLTKDTLYWESTVGATYTQLFPSAAEKKPFWLTELLAKTGVAVRDNRGIFATWLTFGFHFPVVARPLVSDPDPVTLRALDPQTRVDVSVGMLVGVNRGLDLFIEASILDRGDLSDPRTTLPILSGGFDQRRLVFGFNRRFGGQRR
jgi:hypothetical protein